MHRCFTLASAALAFAANAAAWTKTGDGLMVANNNPDIKIGNTYVHEACTPYGSPNIILPPGTACAYWRDSVIIDHGVCSEPLPDGDTESPDRNVVACMIHDPNEPTIEPAETTVEGAESTSA